MRQLERRWRRAGALALVLAQVGCGPGSSGRGGSEGGVGPGYDASSSYDAGSSADVQSPDDTGLPPEREERRNFQLPQAGGRFVYVANPRRDTVAVIDSRSLALQSVEVGDGPTYLATVPGRDVAMVINRGSDTLSILRSTEARTVTQTVPVVHGANAIAISPDARFAVAFLDTDAPGADIAGGSFQDLSVISLEEGRERSTRVSVGFRPTEVVFATDGSRAFVVTEDGISIIRFASITAPTIAPSISLQSTDIIARDAAPSSDASLPDAPPEADASPSDGGDPDAGSADVPPPPDVPAPGTQPIPAPRDISVTPDGRYAIARVEGSTVLRLVNLETREITTFDAGAVVTDVDIVPSGAFAIAVLRERSEALRLPIPAAFAPSGASLVQRISTPGERVGSVAIAPDGRRALLYTTVLDTERITVVDLAGAEAPFVLRLRKSVRSVTFSPDGRTALAVHYRTAGDPNDMSVDLETRIDRSFGYTLLEPSARFAKLQLTPAEVGPFAITPDGSHAFVLLRDDTAGISQVHRIAMQSFQVDTIALGSPPTSVGAVPTTQRAFVGQEHPEGRITFVDWMSGTLQSVTGFELNSRVVM